MMTKIAIESWVESEVLFPNEEEAGGEPQEETRDEFYGGALVRIEGLTVQTQLNGLCAVCLRLVQGGPRWKIGILEGVFKGQQRDAKEDNLVLLSKDARKSGAADRSAAGEEAPDEESDEATGYEDAIPTEQYKPEPRLTPMLLTKVAETNKTVARLEAEVPEPIMWDMKTPPASRGINSSVQFKQVCVYVYVQVLRELKSAKGGARIGWSDECLKILKTKTKDSEKKKKHARAQK